MARPKKDKTPPNPQLEEQPQIVNNEPSEIEEAITNLTETLEAGTATLTEVAESLMTITAEPAKPEVKKFNRLPSGLVEGVEYKYRPDGKIDWRKMIDPQFIFIRDEVKDEVEALYQKKFDELKPSDVGDEYLCVALAGWRELAALRGFRAVRYPNKVAMPEFVSTDCEIDWLVHEDSGYIAQTFTDGASATPENTEGWYGNYLTTAANNRAFSRTVRNYLNIVVVGKDEVGPKLGVERPSNNKATGGVDGFGPHAMLLDILKKKNKSFDDLIAFLKKKGFKNDELDNWKKVDDIPKDVTFQITGLITS